jgi:hypothetical protein
MDIEARCAFVMAQAACVIATTAAMQAENAVKPGTYTEKDFMAMLDSHTVGHNAVITYLAG